MKGRVGLVVAADLEHRAAESILKRFAPDHRFALMKAGIGAIGFEERFSAKLRSGEFKQVIIAGLCGALSPALRRCDVVVYDESRTIESVVGLDPSMTDRIAASLPSIRGTGLTVDRVITEASEKGVLLRGHGAIAVDMETFVIASLCRKLGIPAGVIRVVSDEAHEDLPDFNRSLSETGEIIGWQVPRALLGRPRASWRFVSSLRPTIEAFKKALTLVLEHADVD